MMTELLWFGGPRSDLGPNLLCIKREERTGSKLPPRPALHILPQHKSSFCAFRLTSLNRSIREAQEDWARIVGETVDSLQ